MFKNYFEILFIQKNANNNSKPSSLIGKMVVILDVAAIFDFFFKWAKCIKGSQLCHAQAKSNECNTPSYQIFVEKADDLP